LAWECSGKLFSKLQFSLSAFFVFLFQVLEGASRRGSVDYLAVCDLHRCFRVAFEDAHENIFKLAVFFLQSLLQSSFFAFFGFLFQLC